MVARLLQNSPIWAKAFAASIVLWICLGMLGSTAYLTLEKSARGLSQLRDINLPKQNAASELTHDVMENHVRLFRHVTWGSNGVNTSLLQKLGDRIRAKLTALDARFRFLASHQNVMVDERQNWIVLQTKWKKYEKAARDTLEVAATDAPMATMMLGGTDDDFQQLASGLQEVSAQVSERTHFITGELAFEAGYRKWIIVAGGLAGGLISVLVTLFVAGSIVAPIRSVTRAMLKVSQGHTDLELDSSGRTDEIGQMISAVDSYRDNLQQHSERLRTQNLRFDTALNNMSQGLAMFDAERRLVVCNDRYLRIFGCARDGMRPGLPLTEILEQAVKSGIVPANSLDLILKATAVNASGYASGACYCELNDGRYIAICAQPMPDGGSVATYEDVTDRRRIEAQIAHMAHHDALTGLANRVLLREALEKALAESSQKQFAIFCLDLDRFKEVNDAMGHPAGDLLLQEVADRLGKSVRESDVVARLGGDEFAIVVELSDLESTALAGRIIEELSKPYSINGQQVTIGASIGISRSPKDGNDPDTLIKNADFALYCAKADGRNTYRLFEPEMDMRLAERHKGERDLRQALELGELEVHYQPICAVQTVRTVGMEALVRWRHPSDGLISPDRFIPLAEETGLIIPIGEFVLRRACADALTWPSDTKLAVNLSAVQFGDPDLAGSIAAILAESGLPAGRLELEITESVLLKNSERHINTLHRLRSLGVSIALDDFGTGYCSLSYLRTFPFDKIKIDRSFVSEMMQADTSAAIVCAIANLARSLDITTTAEGVETEEQLQLLRSVGCTQAQGYLLGRPSPIGDASFSEETELEIYQY